MTLSGPLFVNRKKSPKAEKLAFFDFFCCFTTTHWDETFLFLPKFHIFSRLEKSCGDKQNFNFRLKTTPQAKKWLFSKFSFQLHIYPSRRNFFVLTKCSYLQPFREIMGGQKALQTTNKQTTNERTPETIIIARQDSFRILGLLTNTIKFIN